MSPKEVVAPQDAPNEHIHLTPVRKETQEQPKTHSAQMNRLMQPIQARDAAGTTKLPTGLVESDKSWPVTLQGGAVYIGGWLNQTRHGKGTQEWPDGSRYVGEWRNDKANGFGILYHSDGDKYEGNWVDDKANGQGVYTHSNGARYIGGWLDDQ